MQSWCFQLSTNTTCSPVISAPPSSLGGNHDNLQWSAWISLACRFSGAVGASANKRYRTVYNVINVQRLLKLVTQWIMHRVLVWQTLRENSLLFNTYQVMLLILCFVMNDDKFGTHIKHKTSRLNGSWHKIVYSLINDYQYREILFYLRFPEQRSYTR